VVHNCNSSSWESKAGGFEFQTSLGYIVKPCLKKPNQTTTKEKNPKWYKTYKNVKDEKNNIMTI
jgi:hypothetical protein